MKKRTNSKVGSNGPTQATIEACEKLLTQVSERVAAGEKPLTSKERQRTLKLKRGGRGTARILANLAAKNGLGGAVDVDGMLRDVEYSERLQGLAHDAENLSMLLGDLLLQADGRAWKEAVRAYTLLKRVGADDPTVMAQLAPIVGTFATRGRGKNASRGKKGATPEAAAPEDVSPSK